MDKRIEGVVTDDGELRIGLYALLKSLSKESKLHLVDVFKEVDFPSVVKNEIDRLQDENKRLLEENKGYYLLLSDIYYRFPDVKEWKESRDG